MKRTIKLFMCCAFFLFTYFLFITTNAQSTISYSYDANGNRISRILKVGELGKGDINFPVEEDNIEINDQEEKQEEEISIQEGEPSIRVYPNPTRGLVIVVFENYSETFTADYTVHNLNGTVLLHSKIKEPLIEIDLNDFSNGIYILRINISGVIFNYKLIKE